MTNNKSKIPPQAIIGLETPDLNAPRIVMFAEDDKAHRVLAIYPDGRIEVDPTNVDDTARRFVDIVQELARPKMPREDHKAMVELLRKDHGCTVLAALDVDGECKTCMRRADLIVGSGWTRRL